MQMEQLEKIQGWFEILNHKFETLNHKIDSKIDQVDLKLENRTQMILTALLNMNKRFDESQARQDQEIKQLKNSVDDIEIEIKQLQAL